MPYLVRITWTPCATAVSWSWVQASEWSTIHFDEARRFSSRADAVVEAMRWSDDGEVLRAEVEVPR